MCESRFSDSFLHRSALRFTNIILLDYKVLYPYAIKKNYNFHESELLLASTEFNEFELSTAGSNLNHRLTLNQWFKLIR